MKRKVTFYSRLSGILLGFSMTFFIFVFSMTSVLENRDFWLKQNDKYKHQETLNLVSSDDYSTLYRNYLKLFDGENEEFTVTEKANPLDFTDTFFEAGEFLSNSTNSHEITLNEKYLSTVSAIDFRKYAKMDFNGKFFVEFYCPDATSESLGVVIKNLKITDKTGGEFSFNLSEANSAKDGSIITKPLKFNGEINFNPKSIGNRVRLYLRGAEFDTINLSFTLESEEASKVSVRFSYEEILTADDVASRIGNEINILTDSEREQFLHVASINSALNIIAWVLLIGSVLLFLYTVNREGREGLFGIGTYTLILSILLPLIFVALTYTVPIETGFNWVFDFSEGSASSIIFGRNFMVDYVSGLTRFFVFLMLAPIVIGYLLVKKSVKREYDPNEDYLYQ